MQLSAIGAASEVIVLWCCTADCGCSSWYSVWCGLMWVDVKSDFGHFWSLEKHADGCVWLTVFYSNFRSMSKCCWPENRNPQQESLSLTARRGVVNCCTTIQLYNKSTTNRSIMEFKGYSWSTCSSLNSHCAFTVGVVTRQPPSPSPSTYFVDNTIDFPWRNYLEVQSLGLPEGSTHIFEHTQIPL